MTYRYALALSLLFLGVTSSSEGSYRLYQLRIRHYDQLAKKKINRVVLTTMDPVQYEGFHGGPGVMKVEFLDTWYCPGDTSHKKVCNKPKEPIQRGPASLDHPKRIQLPRNLQPVIP